MVRNRISSRKAETIKHSGRGSNAERLHDGGGLYLHVTASGTKSWLFRFTIHGRATLLGLGLYGEHDGISLSKARSPVTLAPCWRWGKTAKAAKQTASKSAKAAAAGAEDRTFKAVAARLLKSRTPEWRNVHHAWQWQQTLEKHAFPCSGRCPWRMSE